MDRLQRSPTFWRLVVGDRGEQVVLDLVAESVPLVEEPIRARIGSVEVWVDTPHEILVNELCSLLGRAEVRDLVDLKALVEQGGDIRRAVADAPSKDGGFSAVTLAWVLNQFDVMALARSEALDDAIAGGLLEFRDALTAYLADWTRPGSEE